VDSTWKKRDIDEKRKRNEVKHTIPQAEIYEVERGAILRGAQK